MQRPTHHRVECGRDSLVGAGPIATQAVADKNAKPSRHRGTDKHIRALAACKLRQERHVYSHDVERGPPSSVGAPCERAGLENFAWCSRPPLVVFMPLLRSLGAIREGRHYYKHVAPTELSRDSDADLVFLACRAGVRRRRARDTAPAAPKSDEGWSPYIDNRLPALHSLGGGGREYKAVYVQSDDEIGLFSDEIVVNCAP